MAGYNAISLRKREIVNNIFKNFDNYLLLTDGELPLYYVDDTDVLCISLGTGTVINTRNGSKIEQYLGLGYAIGDIGSGYDIGRKIIYQALAYKDDELISAVKKVMDIDENEDLIKYIWSDTSNLNKTIASATKSLISPNIRLRKLAFEKYNESINDIVEYVKRIIKQSYTIILNGGIFTHIKESKKIIEKAFPKNNIVLISDNALEVGKKIIIDKNW